MGYTALVHTVNEVFPSRHVLRRFPNFDPLVNIRLAAANFSMRGNVHDRMLIETRYNAGRFGLTAFGKVRAMPLYIYEEILSDGSGGTVYEFIQSIHDAAYTQHPETGKPIRRRVTAPWMPKGFGKHDPKQQLSDKNLEGLGFTKYVRGKNGYEKTAGDGPELIRKP